MEKDVVAVGAREPLVELDGEVQARRQAGEGTGQGYFPAVQVEGERTRDLVYRQRDPEVDEVGGGCAGVPGRLAGQDAAASLRCERGAVADGQERVARGALPRHRERD